MAERPHAETGKGLRERNKEDKLRRIKNAAKTLFEERGYDATTIKDVARFADVGQGTVFFYAPGKRELLFLVVNDDNDKLTREMFDGVNPDLPLLDQLMAVFDHSFRFLQSQGALGRVLLREVRYDMRDDLPAQERRWEENRIRFMDGIGRLFEAAKTRGEVRRDESTDLILRVMFAVYRSEVRFWVWQENQDMAAGMAALRRSLALLVSGLGDAKAAASPSAARIAAGPRGHRG